MTLASAKSIRKPARPDTKSRILAAGKELFASKGYEGVTIRELARHARVTQPLIYHHFGDKRGAYQAVVTSVFSKKAVEGKAVLEAFSDPVDQVYAFVTWLVRCLLHDRVYSRLMHLETIRNPSAVSRELTEQMCPPNYQRLEDLMRRLNPNDDAVSLAFGLYAVTLGFTMFVPFAKGMSVRKPDFTSIDAVVRHILVLVFPGRPELARPRPAVAKATNRAVKMGSAHE